MTKGFADTFRALDADIFCLQETKLQPGQIALDLPGYHQYWCSAEKKGYSGTAVFTKAEPLDVQYNLGLPQHDLEGRVITAEYPEFYLVCVYTPNAQDGLRRLEYRMSWDDAFREFVCSLDRHKPVVICGDMNVAAAEIEPEKPEAQRRQPRLQPRGAREVSGAAARRLHGHVPRPASGRDGRLLVVELPLPRAGEQCRLAHRLLPVLGPRGGKGRDGQHPFRHLRQ